MAKWLSVRVWILIAFLFLSLVAIDPSPNAAGVEISHIDQSSPLVAEGLSLGEKILEINKVKIQDLTTFKQEIDKIAPTAKQVKITTSDGTASYNITSKIGFSLNSNLTIIESADFAPVKKNAKLLEINNELVASLEDFNRILAKTIPKNKVEIKTEKSTYAFLTTGDLGIAAKKSKTSNIEKGLELEGGTRVVLKPITEKEVTANQINNVVDVMNKRMNVYGLADIKISPSKDLDGNWFVVAEIAGATREEVRDIISKQGVFEAKIGDEIVFEGGKQDIPYVCKDDGSCAVIEACSDLGPEQAQCRFRFAITLSAEAAKKHAAITSKVPINQSSLTNPYLEKPLDLYLDGKLVDSLLISADLKGQEATQISISGPGYGPTKEQAYINAVANMNNLQTVLITGSLPFQLEIVKLDTISPIIGKEFLNDAVLVGLLSLSVVSLIIFLKYRNLKIVIPIMITSISEIVITLGFAAVAGWNLDIAAIAGLIATVGTGVNDQIIITDEVMKKREVALNWREKIKRAFFIVFSAYAATVVAMLPLLFAGAGLIKGFALTTIAGITIGVFITRPAYASVIEKLV